MNKYKYLLLNTVLFAFSGILVKLIAFFMLPLYTGVLSTEDYGVAEVLHTTVTLLMPIFTLSVSEAVLRFMFSADSDKQSLFSSALSVVLIGSVLLLALYPIVCRVYAPISEYYSYFILLYVFTALENMLFRFAKGMEKVKTCAMNAVVISCVTVASNLILLLGFGWRVRGYITSMIMAMVASCTFLSISCRVWRYFDWKKIEKETIKEMCIYSIPFIPSAIAWWANSAADKYAIALLLGAGATGLYSAAAKMPSMVSVITSIFTQAWQISGVKEYGSSEYESFFTTVYNHYNALMVIAVSVLIPLSPFFAKFLFAGEFYEAWRFVPILFISAIFNGLSGVLASVFYAVKKTKILMVSTIAGAGVNILLNFVLIQAIGIQGAAIATAFGFICVWFVRFWTTKKYITIQINKPKTVLLYVLLGVQAAVLILEVPFCYWINGAVFIGIVALNRENLKALLHQGMVLVKQKLKK